MSITRGRRTKAKKALEEKIKDKLDSLHDSSIENCRDGENDDEAKNYGAESSVGSAPLSLQTECHTQKHHPAIDLLQSVSKQVADEKSKTDSLEVCNVSSNYVGMVTGDSELELTGATANQNSKSSVSMAMKDKCETVSITESPTPMDVAMVTTEHVLSATTVAKETTFNNSAEHALMLSTDPLSKISEGEKDIKDENANFGSSAQRNNTDHVTSSTEKGCTEPETVVVDHSKSSLNSLAAQNEPAMLKVYPEPGISAKLTLETFQNPTIQSDEQFTSNSSKEDYPALSCKADTSMEEIDSRTKDVNSVEAVDNETEQPETCQRLNVNQSTGDSVVTFVTDNNVDVQIHTNATHDVQCTNVIRSADESKLAADSSTDELNQGALFTDEDIEELSVQLQRGKEPVKTQKKRRRDSTCVISFRRKLASFTQSFDDTFNFEEDLDQTEEFTEEI